MWTKASEVLADAQHQLGGVAPTDYAAWSTAASDIAGTLAALAGRLEPDGTGPLSRAADSMAAAAQTTARPYVRPEALRKTPGVARVATGAMIAGRGGRAATTVLLAQLGRTIRAIESAHRAAGRAQHAAASARAADYLNVYMRESRGPEATAAAPGRSPKARQASEPVQTPRVPPRRAPDRSPRRPPGRNGPDR